MSAATIAGGWNCYVVPHIAARDTNIDRHVPTRLEVGNHVAVRGPRRRCLGRASTGERRRVDYFNTKAPVSSGLSEDGAMMLAHQRRAK
jgi:hypothetical protein